MLKPAKTIRKNVVNTGRVTFSIFFKYRFFYSTNFVINPSCFWENNL